MGVIEEVLRIRDEATPALRGVASAADATDKSMGGLNERLRLGQDAARALGGRYGEMAERANNLGKVLGGLGGGAASVVGVLGATFLVSATAGATLVSAINDLVRSAAEAAPELERLGLITAEQASATQEAARQLEAMETAGSAAAGRLTGELAPALTEIYRIGTQTALALADVTGWLGEQAAAHPTITTGALDAVGGLSVLRRTLEGLDTVTASYREQAQGLAEDLRTIEEDAKKAAKSLADNEKGLTGVGAGNRSTIAGGVAGSAKDNERDYKAVIDGWKRVLDERAKAEEAFRKEQGAAYVEWFDALALEASQRADAAVLLAQGAQSGTTTTDGIPSGAAGGFGFGSSSTQATGAERAQAAFDRIATVGDKTFDLLNAILPPLAESMGPEGKLVLLLLQLTQGFLGGAANGGGFAGGFTGAGEALAGVGVQLAASAASSGFKSRSSGPSFSRGSGATSGRNQRAARDLASSGSRNVTINNYGVMADNMDTFSRELKRQLDRRGPP